MNALLAVGPTPNTLFTVTVQGSGGPIARLAGQRHIIVPLNRLQSTYRRLLLSEYTILSVNRCQYVGDLPSPPPHLALRTVPNKVSEAPGATESSSRAVFQAKVNAPPLWTGHSTNGLYKDQTAEALAKENTVPVSNELSSSEAPSTAEHACLPVLETAVLPTLTEQTPTQSHQGQADENSFEEDVIILLLSLFGVVILLTFEVIQHLAQQWEMRSQRQQHPDPPVVGVQERGLANC